MKRLYNSSEIESILGVTRRTLFEWRKKGFPYKKIGNLVRYDIEEVRHWVEINQKQNRRNELESIN